jgi:1,4-dihydroxy-2-naphthoate polyprenyltransferase
VFQGKVWLFIKLTRPLFLLGGVLLFFLGSVIAWREGAPLSLANFITGQLLVTSIQLMTHYSNEYYDQACDRLNERRTWFSGGSGVLPEGEISATIAWNATRVSAVFALIFLVIAGLQNPVLLGLGLAAMLAAWFYSAPPLALSGSGWGELSASLVVAGLVPIFGYISQSGGKISLPVILVALSLALIHMAMLIAFEIPDRYADAQTGKRTLAVRFGLVRAAQIHNLALLLAFLLIFVLAVTGKAAAGLVGLAAPLAIWQALSIYHYLNPDTHNYLGLTMKALALFTLCAALWLAGFVL